jgi:tetratricopeptide (TPR) repeat protein
VTDGYSVASLTEMEVPLGPESARWATVRSHFGIEAFGVNAWTSKEAGQTVIGEHDEVGGGAGQHEELYVVVTGKAMFTVDGQTVDAPAGTLVFVRDPAAKRMAVAEEAETTILALGAKPGEAFKSSNWERSAPALAYFATKEYDKAITMLSATLEEFPDDPAVLYNLACAESMAGKPEDALAHLARSVEQGERYLELARTDTDFDPIRAEPEFERLLG